MKKFKSQHFCSVILSPQMTLTTVSRELSFLLINHQQFELSRNYFYALQHFANPLRRYWLCTFWLNHNSHRNHFQKLFFFFNIVKYWKSFVRAKASAHLSRWFTKTWLNTTAQQQKTSLRPQNLFFSHTKTLAQTHCKIQKKTSTLV